MHALLHRRDALQTHAGVHRRLRQFRQLALGVAVELHEYEIPDLDVAVAVLVRRTRRAAGNVRPVVVKHLGTGAAGAGVAHLPEIGGFAQAHEVFRIDADLLQPDVRGFVVILIYRDPELVLGQLQFLRQKLPGKADGLALEVIAEAEVAEHLEEGVVPAGVADIFKIVVLAAGAHAALRARGAHVRAFLLPQEHVLELHHAGVGEQKRRVVHRHERA